MDLERIKEMSRNPANKRGPVNIRFADIYRIENEIITGQWDVVDHLNLLKQTGALPSEQARNSRMLGIPITIFLLRYNYVDEFYRPFRLVIYFPIPCFVLDFLESQMLIIPTIAAVISLKPFAGVPHVFHAFVISTSLRFCLL